MRPLATFIGIICANLSLLLAQGKPQEQPFPEVPPLIALVECERKTQVQEAFALLENGSEPLASRVRMLQQWSRQKRFYYTVKGQYHLLISQELFTNENPNQARYELLRMLAETIRTKQLVPVETLSPALREALVSSLQRGSLLMFSGFEHLINNRASFVMLGARVVAEWQMPDGTIRRTTVGQIAPSAEHQRNLVPPSGSAPLPSNTPPFTQCLVYNTPAASTVFTQGIRYLSIFWETLDQQAKQNYKELTVNFLNELRRELETQYGQRIATDTWIGWEDMPLSYQEQMIKNLQHNHLERPTEIRLTLRPAMYALFVDTQRRAIHQLSWGLDELVVPITYGLTPLK
jgi:hypothetical protein